MLMKTKTEEILHHIENKKNNKKMSYFEIRMHELDVKKRIKSEVDENERNNYEGILATKDYMIK